MRSIFPDALNARTQQEAFVRNNKICKELITRIYYNMINWNVLTLIILLVFWSAAYFEHDFHVVRRAATTDSAVDVVLGRRG